MQSSYYLPFTHFAVVRSLLCDWKIFDWEREIIVVARPKQRRAQEYPLVKSLGEALVRYLQQIRPRSARREIFLTFKAPFRPLSAGALYHLVSSRVSKLSIQIPSRGPHSLRHACAEHLMAEGSHSKRLVITSDTVAPMQLGSMPRWT